MNILLIYPRWDYPTFGALQEPLGLACISAALKIHGHHISLIDLSFDPVENIEKALPDTDLVGISASTALYGRAYKVLDIIRKSSPDVPVILGGPHATVSPEEVLSNGFSAAVLGEAEHTVVDLVDAIKKGKPLFEVAGVVSLKDGNPVHGPVRPFEKDLDLLPDADRTLINYDEYFKRGLSQVGIMANRGCPWNCLFCKPMQDKMFGRKIRRRSTKRIAEEMANIYELTGKTSFTIRDDTFVLAGLDWFIDFEKELIAHGIPDVNWACQGRVDQADRDLLIQMKKCGLEGMAFGVESGSQKVLDYYRKNIKVQQTIDAFKLCDELNIGTHAFLMLGAPIEDKDDLAATVKLVETIRPKSISVAITTPAPGTDLFSHVQEAGLFNIQNPEEADYLHNIRPLNLKYLTSEDIAQAEREILDLVPGTNYKEDLEKRTEMLENSGAS
jgi:radical SAM superfamily enzyme YgiQ (UPF0313 family)